jgi:type II secretory pathway component PulM
VKLDWRNTFSFYQRLSPRERTLVGIAGGTLALIGLYSLVVDPLADLRERIGSRITQKQKELVEIQRMRDEYFDLLQQYEASQAILAKPRAGFSLFSHVESTVSQVVSRDHITSMNPGNKALGNAYREESVELKLTGISLKQLVDMMYRIEKGPHQLRMTRLQVKKQSRDPHSFDVTATVSMIQAREG